MTIGNELDQAFYNITQRLTRLEGNNNETVLGIETDLTSLIEELQRNVSDLDFDSLESEIDDVRDSLSYIEDRVDAVELTEDEVEYIVDRRFDKAFDSALEDLDLASLLLRVAELEDRLNKPSLSGRIVRWLREGPSIKEVATSWYAGIRRGS